MSNERKWTPAQSAAMSASGRTLLISAAAGSGKTATLTERIIRRLTDPASPADLSRMLIVTFTRAAAAELKERISAALTAAIAKDPGNRHLQNQLIGLGGAHISTIDAFCREPVKLHFADVGLPATSRIADEAELLPLCERIMGDVIEEFYIKYAAADRDNQTFSLLHGNPFADLCDSITRSGSDKDLIPRLLELYNRLLSFPEEISRLQEESTLLLAQAEGDFFASAHGRIIADWIRHFTDSAIRTLEEALSDIEDDPAACKAYFSAFSADLDFCRHLARAATYGEAYNLMTGYENERLGSLRNASPVFVAHKDARTEIVATIKKLRTKYFADTQEAVTLQMKETAVMCAVLFDLLSEYDRRILAEKKNRGICDFTDNRRYLLSMLRKSDGTPSGMALELRDRFDEVYIDEYRDVDEMQDEIFRLVGDNHRFMVGDIKQSIYGFRGADPSVFARYRRDLTQLTQKGEDWVGDDPHGNSIFMSENFRCDESVIRVTNAVCGHIFRACPHSVGYQDGDDLVHGKKPPHPAYESPQVQVNVLVAPPKTRGGNTEEGDEPLSDREELDGVEAEATFVANEIASLLRSKTRLANGEIVKPSDIAILMRSNTALSAYVQALTALGIPTGSEELEETEAGKDILHGSDMSYLVNLLRVIDNPSGDIPLSELLRAPFPGLDLEELILLRNVGDRRAESYSLYAGIEEYPLRDDADPVLVQKLADFTGWLNHYRRLTTTQPADSILRLLRQDPKCACRESAAFLYTYECARTCRTSAFLSLYAFLRYFESKLASTKKAPAPEGKDSGRISIMTIHKSKGLEFPVCFVVRCGQTFSAKSYATDMIFEKQAGVAMKLYRRVIADGVTTQYKRDTTLRTASALSLQLTEREEEMRVLYVAMTRARERLYLVGTGNEKPVSFAAGDRFATLSCSSYLKWVLGALAAHPDVLSHVSLSYHPTETITPDEPLPRAYFSEEDTEEDKALAARYAAVLEKHTDLSPLAMIARRVPTKIPASRMKDHILDHCVFYETDLDMADGKLPLGQEEGTWCDAQSLASIRRSLELMASTTENEFELLLSENTRPTPSEKGTATHLFLQYCDYDRVRAQGIEEEISRLATLGFINARTASILDRAMLKAFFESRFFARVAKAKVVRRELRFTRFLPLASLTTHEELSSLLGDRTLLVQGSIDILCEFEDGHLEICDYKTDHITPAEKRDPALLQKRMSEAHKDQLIQYAAAVEDMYGRRPTRVSIFSLLLGEALDVEIS